MMTENQFNEWARNLMLSDQAINEIQRIRLAPPARKVGGGKRNVSGRYSSSKMGFTIQFESHKVELPIIYLLEYNDEVLEYYDQPSKIKILYEQSGKKIAYWKTADFFVIEKNKAYWIECKTEDELIKKSQQNPERYYRENNEWFFSPGRDYSRQFELDFLIYSSKEINWNLQRNLNFLEDYIIKEYRPLESKIGKVKELIISSPGLSLGQLFKKISNDVSADDIYSLIAKNIIYMDLNNCVITDWENTKIFLNKEQAKSFFTIEKTSVDLNKPNVVELESGKKILWGDTIWNILNYDHRGKVIFLYDEVSKKNVELPVDLFQSYVSEGYIKGTDKVSNNENDQISKLILQASEKDLKEANYRYEIVTKYLNEEEVISLEVTDRTLRNWIKKYNDAEKLYGNGFIGLLPKIKNRGNRNSKLPNETKELMEELVNGSYNNIKSKSMKAVYRELLVKCDELGVTAPSYQTFCTRINSQSKYEMTKARAGERAAYKHEAFYVELDFTTPKHGERIFEIAHIDHTELDIELRLNNEITKRPWLTLMIDAYSRRILAFYLTFEEPSYRSCMMVIRECVREFNRLPSYIVVDGGKEFGSIYFESLLAMYGVHKKQRPPAKARFGNVVERLFGISNSLLIHNLKGNTQITKNVRQVTKSVNPRNQAVWTLDTLYELLDNWFSNIYDNMENPSTNQTPKDAFNQSIAISGSRLNTFIPYDETFILMTLPSPKGKTRKVNPGQGIKLSYSYYWCEEFKNPKIENSNVEVKYDPFDMGIAFAFINNKWVKCLSEQYKYLQGKTEKQIKLIAEEIRQKNKIHTRNNTVTAKMIARFILESEDIEEQLSLESHHISKNKKLKSLEHKVVESENTQQNNKSKDIYDDDELEIFEELI